MLGGGKKYQPIISITGIFSTFCYLWSSPYLLDFSNPLEEFLCGHTAGDDLQRNPVLPNEEARWYTHHRVFKGVKAQPWVVAQY